MPKFTNRLSRSSAKGKGLLALYTVYILAHWKGCVYWYRGLYSEARHRIDKVPSVHQYYKTCHRLSQDGAGVKARLWLDRLIINSKTYTVDILCELPENLNPANLETKHIGNDTIASWGCYSPLSNHWSDPQMWVRGERGLLQFNRAVSNEPEGHIIRWPQGTVWPFWCWCAVKLW